MKRIRQRLAAEVRSLRGANAEAVIRQAQPDHPGLGRLLPERGLQRGVRHARSPPVAAPLPVGAARPPEQAETLGRQQILRQVQPVQDRTGGSSVTATAASTCASSSGQRSSATRLVMGTASPDDPALGPVLGSSAPQNVLAPGRNHRVPAASAARTLPRLRTRSCCMPTTVRKVPTRVGAVDQAPSRRHCASNAVVLDAAHGDDPTAHRLMHAHCRQRTTKSAAGPANQ